MAIKLWFVMEAVAPEKQSLEQTLEEHVESIESEDGVEITEIQFDETVELKDPHPGLDKGYSQVCEMRLEAETFQRAVQVCVDYGPTYVQVEGPEKLEMDLKETQESLQKVVDTMHKYAQMGAGGVLVSRTESEE